MAIDVTLSNFAVDGAARSDSFSRMNTRFSTALADMLAAAPPEIQSKLRISSGYRSVERQTQLFEAALTKYGSPAAARRWVAPPGHSMHNHGFAADLKYLSPAARHWAHANAERFGLVFPLSNENWHVELAGARDGKVAPDLGGATVLTAALTPGAAAKPMSGRALDETDAAPSYASKVALFLLTQHTPPERAKDERAARYPQTRPLPGAWYHA
jgi:hypothetical protein